MYIFTMPILQSQMKILISFKDLECLEWLCGEDTIRCIVHIFSKLIIFWLAKETTGRSGEVHEHRKGSHKVPWAHIIHIISPTETFGYVTLHICVLSWLQRMLILPGRMKLQCAFETSTRDRATEDRCQEIFL